MGFRTVEKANKPLVMVTVSIMFLRAILKRTVEVPASWKHQECVPKQNRQDFWIFISHWSGVVHHTNTPLL